MKKKNYKSFSPAYKIKLFKRWRKKNRREIRGVAFICPECLNGFNAYAKCRIKTVYCGKCGCKMSRRRGFFCQTCPEKTKCDCCGFCETGTDADFDTHAVDVQNGYGYYNEAGDYVSYGPNAI